MGKKSAYAVITGASSGIGREFARRLAKEGYNLILVARRKDRLQELSKELSLLGSECILMPMDLSKEKKCYKLADNLADKKIGIFINNAGFGDSGLFVEGSMEREMEMVNVNVRAVHILTKRMLQQMKKQGGGYILNVASSAGLMPAGPYMAVYYATKAYVTSLTRAVAEELRQQGSPIYVGCLCPGPVDTEFNEVANVEFALRGISAFDCANYAVEQMKRRRVVIVPSLAIKSAMTLGRFLPQKMYVRIAAHQQKKKMACDDSAEA